MGDRIGCSAISRARRPRPPENVSSFLVRTPGRKSDVVRDAAIRVPDVEKMRLRGTINSIMQLCLATPTRGTYLSHPRKKKNSHDPQSQAKGDVRCRVEPRSDGTEAPGEWHHSKAFPTCFLVRTFCTLSSGPSDDGSRLRFRRESTDGRKRANTVRTY
ncbi:hypothetical protein M011DRAFT_471625 [Sporormia fimetaria CBS 119925]|uniref:Uncharacterized protein n=1 Tax=Sporormia fimetaria CBS 119925 TaxID=1340428 RepID=A0A6A6UXS9_9PLEO|nr:hypothetical protein M011DRAFT_471625 [Sporormia fimetaria CBS 119925]